MITYYNNMRKLLQPQGKDLRAAENRITCQKYGGSSEPGATLRLDVPGFSVRKIILPRTNFRLPVKGGSLTVAKAIDYRDRSAVVPARIVTNIDDDPVQVIEVTSDRVQCVG